MDEKKTLIIIDNSAQMRNLATSISDCFKNPSFAGYSVSTIEVAQFSAADILPVRAFFLGCQNPKSFSLSYIEDLFAHINLAKRPCGIFSTNSMAIRYLTALLRPCEAKLGEPLLVKGDTIDGILLQNWILGIVSQWDIDG